MDFTRSFSHAFKDGSWFFKVFIGGLFVVVSVAVIGCPFILGYQARHVSAVVNREDSTLPEWKNLSAMFTDGTHIFLALAVYFATIAGVAAAVFGIHGRWTLLILGLLLLSMVRPIVLVQYVRRKTFLSCFRIYDMASSFVKHPISYGTGLIVSMAVTVATFSLGWMSLILGWPFIVFWGIIVESHIAGQLADLS